MITKEQLEALGFDMIEIYPAHPQANYARKELGKNRFVHLEGEKLIFKIRRTEKQYKKSKDYITNWLGKKKYITKLTEIVVDSLPVMEMKLSGTTVEQLKQILEAFK